MDSELAYGLQQRRDPGKPRHATYARAETEGLGSDQISETALKSDGLANRPAFCGLVGNARSEALGRFSNASHVPRIDRSRYGGLVVPLFCVS